MSYLVTPGPPVDLDNGRVVAAGEKVTRLNANNDHNRRLIASGRLVEQKPKKSPKAAKEESA